jgi:hypothetical protein
VVPCWLTIQCEDSQALDLLSAPEAPTIYLKRSVEFTFNPTIPNNLNARILRLSSATWRPSLKGITPNENRRHLDGEIPLQKDLVPSSSMIHFAVMVCLLYLLVTIRLSKFTKVLCSCPTIRGCWVLVPNKQHLTGTPCTNRNSLCSWVTPNNCFTTQL